MKPALVTQSGMADARAGRPPYLLGLVTDREHRREFMRDGLGSIANLLLMGVLLDSVFQWVRQEGKWAAVRS